MSIYLFSIKTFNELQNGVKNKKLLEIVLIFEAFIESFSQKQMYIIGGMLLVNSFQKGFLNVFTETKKGYPIMFYQKLVPSLNEVA